MRVAWRSLIAVIATLALITGLTACADASPEEARPVTTEESQLLAITRFASFDAGSRGFAASVREEGTDLALQGWVDFHSQLGYASVTGDFAPQALLWTGNTVGIIPVTPDLSGNPPLPIPALDDANWTSRPGDPTSSRLDSVLAVIAGLGADRPDNPLLVQQTGALWLREDEVDGVAVTVFAAPPSDEPLTATSPPVTADTSSLRLWVDANGVTRRVEVRIGTDWSTIDFTDPGEPLSLPDEPLTLPGEQG